MSNINNKDYISKKLVTKNLDKNKYQQIKQYVDMILIEKNNYAKILSDDLLMKLKILAGLGKFKFSNEYQKVELVNKECPKSDLQAAREDVYTKFINQVNNLNVKFVKTYHNDNYLKLKKKYDNVKSYKNMCKEDNLQNLLNYLCKQFLYCKIDEFRTILNYNNNLYNDIADYYLYVNTDIYDYIFSRNTTTYKNWQNIINKFTYERILRLALKKFLKSLKDLNIIFNKATIQHKNTINSFDNHFEKVNNIKYNNLLFNVNLPKIGLVKIPFKTNYFYHYKMDNLNIIGTNKTKDKKYESKNYFVQTMFIYTIKIDELNKEIEIIYAIPRNDKNSKSNYKFDNAIKIEYNKTIGIDVNTKNNIFTLSDGKTFKYDKWIIEKCIKFDKDRANYQKLYGKKEYNKCMKKRQKNMNNRSKAFLDKKVNELINYCKEKGYNHIVMENLNIQGSRTNIKNKDGINYNRLASLIHLNDIKNVIKRIANHNGIMVSYVDPKYTSKQCLICGNIDKNNRKTQETFVCTCCKHEAYNADLNAACNIKNRLVLFKDELNIKFDKELNEYKESKYHCKQQYLDLYKNFDVNLISDQIWLNLNI